MVNKTKRPRGRPSLRTGPKQHASPKSSQKAEKSYVVEESSKEEVMQFDSLEMRIHHSGNTHEPQTLTDKVVYRYKPAIGEVTNLDMDKINELSQEEENNEEVTYEDKDKAVSVKKSMIDSYRKKSNYFGPLRIIAEKANIKEDGVTKEVIQAKLQHVEIQATDSQGKCVNDHELKILMSQTPGIIPACDPPSKETEEEGSAYIVLNLGPGEKYKVLKKAMTAFKKLSGVEPPFNTKIQKVFTTIDGKATPITLVTLYPRVNKVVYRSTQLNDKNQPLKNIMKKDKGKQPKLVNYYRQNYINWAHRGNICFGEIKKIGMDFVEEVLNDNPVIEDCLKDLGCSLASTATSLEDGEDNVDNAVETTHPVGSKDFVEDVWQYLSTLVRNDNLLIEFEYEMDEEKWLEIKRAFNMFQVSGEVLPDIVLKIACKSSNNEHHLSYYLRCVGRLIKSGPILSKVDVHYLLKCLTKDKYICVGLDKENFLQQADQNEMLRLHLKENGLLSTLPFESIYSKKCKAIIREVDNVDNMKFERGQFTVFGPCVICQPCDTLHKRLKELVDPSLNMYAPLEPSLRYVKQRYGPIQSINVIQSIKNLFTQTPQEFISGSKRKLANWGASEAEESFSKQQRLLDSNLDGQDDDKLSIGVNEDEFDTMITIKKPSGPNGTSKKVCEKCGFHAKSMLSLFVHINDHLGPLSEECVACNIKLSSKEAVVNHKRICHTKKSARCSICNAIYLSSEKLFEHMNRHRSCLPFVCVFCDQRLQTMNEYKKHLKISHQIATVKQLNFVCKICNSYFYTEDHLLIHRLNQNHIEKEHLKCKICNFSCIIASAFLTHILNHSYDQRESSNLATCLKCKKVFFSSFTLEDHLKKKHETKINPNHIISHPTMVENEEESVQSYSGFTCGKCFKVYGTINALQKHMEVSHTEKDVVESPPVVVNAISCNICGRKFNSEHFLNSHMKLHTANKPVFQCEECGFVYGKRTQVLEHIRSDHAEQVEKHQQMQQQQQHHHHHEQQQQHPQHQPQHHHQHEIITENPIYEAQPNTYPGGQVITMENQPQLVQAQPETGWNQLKIPTVDHPQEVTYNFQNFNPQFF